MIVNKKLLLEKAPIKDMVQESIVFNGRSYGLSHAGYDIRLKQRIVFTPALYIPNETTGFYDMLPACIEFDNKAYENTNLAIASAIEEFNMPDDLVGVVHDKSTNAREGISVFNTVIEPSWKGFLTLEIVFHGAKRIVLEAGTPIAQVLFHSLSESSQYRGKYQNQPDKPVNAILE